MTWVDVVVCGDRSRSWRSEVQELSDSGAVLQSRERTASGGSHERVVDCKSHAAAWHQSCDPRRSLAGWHTRLLPQRSVEVDTASSVPALPLFLSPPLRFPFLLLHHPTTHINKRVSLHRIHLTLHRYQHFSQPNNPPHINMTGREYPLHHPHPSPTAC